MKRAAELGDHDRLSGRYSRQARIRARHLEPETFRAVDVARGEWAVSTQRDPITIRISRIIILEPVPFRFGLIEPVHVPNPLQIIGALPAHQVHDMAVRRHVSRRSVLRAAVPFSVPGKPFSVRLGSPFHQDRRRELLGVACPRFQVVVEFPCKDVRERKCFLGAILLRVGAQHQPQIWNFSKSADPIAGFSRKFLRFEPVVGKENPGRFCSQRLFKTGDVSCNDVVFGRVPTRSRFVEIKTLI